MRFQLTKQHVMSALDMTINHPYAVQALAIQGMTFVAVLVLYRDRPEKIVPILFVTIVVFIIYFLPKYLLARHRFIKLFTTFPEFIGPMDVEVVGGELVVKTEKSTSATPRDWINKVKSNDQVTVLYRASIPCFIIPAEVVTADENIRTYLATKPPPAR